MNAERICAGLCMALSLAKVYFQLLLALHTKIGGLPGAGMFVGTTLEKITTKYHTDIFTPIPVVSVAWILINLTSFCSAYGLWQYSTKSKIFDLSIYMFWIVEMLVTDLWTLAYDREELVISLILVSILGFSSFNLIFKICNNTFERRYVTKKEPVSDDERWWTETIQLDFAGILFIWHFIALGGTIAYTAYYKSSFGLDEAELVGWFDLETVGTLSLLVTILAQALWTLADVSYFPLHTEHVRTVYPFLTFSMMGAFLFHYDSDVGLSRNNLICLSISLVSFITFLNRAKLRVSFSNLFAEKAKRV